MRLSMPITEMRDEEKRVGRCQARRGHWIDNGRGLCNPLPRKFSYDGDWVFEMLSLFNATPMLIQRDCDGPSMAD